MVDKVRDPESLADRLHMALSNYRSSHSQDSEKNKAKPVAMMGGGLGSRTMSVKKEIKGLASEYFVAAKGIRKQEYLDKRKLAPWIVSQSISRSHKPKQEGAGHTIVGGGYIEDAIRKPLFDTDVALVSSSNLASPPQQADDQPSLPYIPASS